MPSEANAKHADTSHAQNRRSPHLYPSRRSQGSTYAGVPPPPPHPNPPLPSPCACTHCRQAGIHYTKCGQQHIIVRVLGSCFWRDCETVSPGFLLKARAAICHVEVHFAPDHRTDAQQYRGVQVSVRCLSYLEILCGRQERTRGDIYDHICTELSRGSEEVRGE